MSDAQPSIRPARVDPTALRRAFLEQLGVTGLVLAQPLFDLLGRNPSLVVLWGVSAAELIVFALAVVFVPPILLTAVEAMGAAIAPRFSGVLHRALLALGLGVFGHTVVKRVTELGALVSIGVGILSGVVWFIVLRRSALRLWVRYLSPAPVVFALIFVFASAVTPVAFERDPGVDDVAIGAPARVVFVMLDELPLTTLLDGEGRIDADLFPSFAALADSSTWYRNATTASPLTETAVPAALSGQLPTGERVVPFVSEYPNNLFTLLGDGGYSLRVHESVTRLCPESRCPKVRTSANIHHGLTGMIRDSLSLWRDEVGVDRRDGLRFDGLAAYDTKALRTADRFVSRVRPSDGPRLDFLHVLLPHFPWHYLPTGQDYVAFPAHRNGFVDGIWENQTAADAAKVRHVLQTQAVDRWLGELLGRLRDLGVADDTLLVVTADHGAAFAGGLPFRGVSDDTWPEIAWIPLFVRYPGQTAGAVDDRPARSIDLLPTIADALEADLPWPVDGTSLLGPAPSGETDRRELLDVDASTLRPAGESSRLELDGVEGFQRVLSSRGVAGDADDELRPYRVGPDGELLGDPAPDHRDGGTIEVAIDRLDTYARVDHFLPVFPWSVFHATAPTLVPGRRVLLVVDGRVAVATSTMDRTTGAGSEMWGLIPPGLLAFGANELEVLVEADDGSGWSSTSVVAGPSR
jgi:hypothetical protein